MNRKEEKIFQYLDSISKKEKDLIFCVIGAGNGGLAMAGHLAFKGFHVRLVNRTDEKLNAVRWHGGIVLNGEVKGFGKIELATSVFHDGVKDADVIMVCTPATAHEDIAKKIAPYLKEGQIVVLNPGRTFGALEFLNIIRKKGNKNKVIICETQTFIYASRAISQFEVNIFRIKNSVPLATIPAFWIPSVLKVINIAFSQFIAGDNVLATSFENIGAVFHPAITVMNAGWIEATHGDFDYYLEGVTPAVAKVLEEIDRERIAVASALGIRVLSAREWLYLTYDSSGSNLYEAIKNTLSYKGIKAPSSIMHRYIWEDVPMSLVPICSVGEMFGLNLKSIRQIISLASIMHKTDYWKKGRTVERLNISGLSVKQIRRLTIDGF